MELESFGCLSVGLKSCRRSKASQRPTNLTHPWPRSFEQSIAEHGLNQAGEMVWVAKIEVDDSAEIAEGWIGTSFGVELNTAAKSFPTGPGLLPRTPASKANFDFFASLTAVAWSNNIFLFFPAMLSTSTAIAISEATGGGGEVACSADPWVGVGEGGGDPRSEGRGEEVRGEEGRGEEGIGSGDLKEEPSGGVEGGDSSMAHNIGVRGNKFGVGIWSRVGGKLGVCEGGSLMVKATEDR